MLSLRGIVLLRHAKYDSGRFSTIDYKILIIIECKIVGSNKHEYILLLIVQSDVPDD